MFVFSTGADKKVYHKAAEISEVVLGENLDDHISTVHPFSSNLIPVDKPLTPPPTTKQRPLFTSIEWTIVYYEFAPKMF